MNMKKVLTGTLASVMAVSTMAVFASADDITVDQSKVVWGDFEDKGNIRIEFYNQYGPTANNNSDEKHCDPSVDPDTFYAEEGGNLIKITFTIAGLPDGIEAHNATLGYGFSTTGTSPQYPITGNGTYTVEFEGDGDVNGTGWLSVDIAGLAKTLGVGKSDVIKDLDPKSKEAFDALVAATKEKITISDVKITITNGEASEPTTQEPAASSDAETSKDPTGNTQAPGTDDKGQPNTGVEGVAVVAGLAVLATGAIVIAKKRK